MTNNFKTTLIHRTFDALSTLRKAFKWTSDVIALITETKPRFLSTYLADHEELQQHLKNPMAYKYHPRCGHASCCNRMPKIIRK